MVAFSKKIIVKSLLIFTLVGMVSFPSYMVKADDASQKNDMFLTETAPNDLIEAVKARLPYFDSILLNDEGISSGNKSLGTPFSVYDDDEEKTYFYFPLYDDNGVMLKTIFCYKIDNKWQTNLSGYLVDKLPDFFEKDPNLKSFVQKNADLYLVDQNNELTLFNDSPVSNGYISPKDVSIKSYKRDVLKAEVINKNMYTLPTPVKTYSNKPTSIPYAEGQKYLDLDFLETQGANNWCAAYVTTSIIRYATKDRNPTAKQMMQYFYPNTSNLED